MLDGSGQEQKVPITGRGPSAEKPTPKPGKKKGRLGIIVGFGILLVFLIGVLFGAGPGVVVLLWLGIGFEIVYYLVRWARKPKS